MRWIALIGAVISLFLLASGHVNVQWIGWSISCVTCLAWAYFAKIDGDAPRMLMELLFFIAATLGVYNWFGRV